MTEGTFKRELGKAQTMQRLEADPMKAASWRGYQRGIRRAYHGARFGTEEEHGRFMDAAASADEERAAIGRGYRDGFTFNGKDSQE